MAAIREEFKLGYVDFMLRDVPIRFAHLLRPDTEFGNNRYSMEILASDELAKELEDMGYELKEKVDKEGNTTKNILLAKSQVLDRAGNKMRPPIIVGPDGKTPWTEEIGNGTVVNAKLQARAWKVSGKWQLGCYIKEVQIAKHIPKTSSGFQDLTKTDDIPF